MDPNRWAKVKEVLLAVITVDHAERASVLEQRCDGDPGLKEEVSVLLTQHDHGANFLEQPALSLAAEWLAEEETPQRLGPWRILHGIGGGGMADVYLAERADGQFEKKAAVKIIKPGQYGKDLSSRFRTERQLLATLDHPNIVHLLDGGVIGDGRPYLVMDYVDGSPISTYVAEAQPSVAERLALFLNVCDAVGYAHSRSIVHRDMKPGNILVTRGGVPKLLDFGIAKLIEPQLAGSPAELTQTRSRYFTLEYASPEQVQGKSATAAGDIYSLGLVLYRILTDRHPFNLEGLAAYEAARVVCEESPDLTRLSAGLAAIVGKATQKVPERRYDSIDQFAGALHRYLESPRTMGFRATVHKHTMQACGAIAIVLLAVLASRFAGRSQYPNDPPFQFTARPLTNLPGLVESPTISPDGANFAYAWNGEDRLNAFHLYIQPVTGGKPKRLAGGRNQKWSPDGRFIATLRKIKKQELGIVLVSPRSGEEAELVRIHGLSVFETTVDDLVAWSADSKYIAIPDRGSVQQPFSIVLISAVTGAIQKLTSPPEGTLGDVSSAFSPDGSRLAVVRCITGHNCDLYGGPITGESVHRLTWDQTTINGLDWTPDSRELVFSSYRTRAIAGLWRMPVAPVGSRDRKEPSIVTVLEGDAILPTMSRPAGGLRTRLVFQHRIRRENVWRSSIFGDVEAKAVRVTDAATVADSPMFSADGSRIAFSSEVSGNREIWAADADGSNATCLTAMKDPFTDSPRWSPDARWISFSSASGDNRDIFRVPSAGGVTRRLTTEPSEEGRASWSSDGRWIYFRSDRSGSRQIWKMRSDGTGAAMQITHGGGFEAFESLDGKLIYYSRGYEVPEIWRVSPNGGEERLVLRGAEVGLWAVSSLGIHFMERNSSATTQALKLYRFSTGEVSQTGVIHAQLDDTPYGFSVSRDGSSFLWVRRDRNTSDVLTIDNFR